MTIPASRLEIINRYIQDPDNTLVNRFLEVIEKYGGVDEIERKAATASALNSQLKRLREMNSPFLKDIEWLQNQAAGGKFISMQDYRRKILGSQADRISYDETFAVTLEISACQYFEYFVAQTKRAIEYGELMPGRFIRVRKMKEQEQNSGEIIAFGAAMNIIGATYVETMDTKGTDGSNVHLGGPDTITGYFGGVGEPNGHALKWLDEFLYYYTNYGVRQVLNINPGTVMLGYWLRKIGVKNEFKISVYMGNDNPYAAFWTLMAAKLFSDDGGGTSLIGFNFSNSVDNETIEISAECRKALELEDLVRFEHHIIETWKSIVIQPYDRRDELLYIADHVKNISAKHEGGNIETEQTRKHPSDILDYFRDKQEIIDSGDWDALLINYLDKHQSVKSTADALIKSGCSVIAARNLHK
ncbi:hypothetical protein JXA40_10055 [bacterium]|nr:hypothetical protein [candidate division CSSED10-310 bacterium]